MFTSRPSSIRNPVSRYETPLPDMKHQVAPCQKFVHFFGHPITISGVCCCLLGLPGPTTLQFVVQQRDSGTHWCGSCCGDAALGVPDLIPATFVAKIMILLLFLAWLCCGSFWHASSHHENPFSHRMPGYRQPCFQGLSISHFFHGHPCWLFLCLLGPSTTRMKFPVNLKQSIGLRRFVP